MSGNAQGVPTGGKAGIAALVVVLIATPFVAQLEGVETKTYYDIVGVRTSCVGETDKRITIRENFTRDECFAVFGASLYVHALELDKCVKRPLTSNEAAAVLSWGYNVGATSACKSTLVRQINAGEPASTWCNQFARWVYAGGSSEPIRGLVNRRMKERALCLTK